MPSRIEQAIKKINYDDLSNNFVEVFPSDKMTKFIDYKLLNNQKTGKYPFLISNTEDSTKDGEHWRSILDIEQKKYLFFLLVWHRRIKKLHHNRRQKKSAKNFNRHRKND